MLVHLRLTVPCDLSERIVDQLVSDPAVTNVTVIDGASRKPAGDLVEADVAREVASDTLSALRRTGLMQRGGVVISRPDGTPFDAAREIDLAATGDPDDAVVWDVVHEQAQDAARPTLSYQIFLVIAVALASVAVITDSAILVVGAMVVGPEFATVAAVCTGLALRDLPLARRSLLVLLVSFAFAVVVIAGLSLIAHLCGVIGPDVVARDRPQTEFIWKPNTWSVVVALLAGAAGVLALTVEKAQAMVGVFISVTTVPAAGNLALALGLWVPKEIAGSAGQLGVNLVGMVVAGWLVLVVQRHAWAHVQRVVKPLLRRGRA